jgi:ketosteroid isomerase-like protein
MIGNYMDRMLGASLGVAFLLALGACADGGGAEDPQLSQDELVSGVRAAEASLLRAMLEKDPEAAAAHYAQDAVVSLANEPAIVGRGLIADDFRIGLPALISNENRPERIETSKSGELACVQGSFRSTYTNLATDKRETLTGTYITV